MQDVGAGSCMEPGFSNGLCRYCINMNRAGEAEAVESSVLGHCRLFSDTHGAAEKRALWREGSRAAEYVPHSVSMATLGAAEAEVRRVDAPEAYPHSAVQSRLLSSVTRSQQGRPCLRLGCLPWGASAQTGPQASLAPSAGARSPGLSSTRVFLPKMSSSAATRPPAAFTTVPSKSRKLPPVTATCPRREW